MKIGPDKTYKMDNRKIYWGIWPASKDKDLIRPGGSSPFLPVIWLGFALSGLSLIHMNEFRVSTLDLPMVDRAARILAPHPLDQVSGSALWSSN